MARNGMLHQRVLPFHLVSGLDRSGKLAADGDCEHATVLVSQPAGVTRHNHSPCPLEGTNNVSQSRFSHRFRGISR